MALVRDPRTGTIKSTNTGVILPRRVEAEPPRQINLPQEQEQEPGFLSKAGGFLKDIGKEIALVVPRIGAGLVERAEQLPAVPIAPISALRRGRQAARVFQEAQQGVAPTDILRNLATPIRPEATETPLAPFAFRGTERGTPERSFAEIELGLDIGGILAGGPLISAVGKGTAGQILRQVAKPAAVESLLGAGIGFTSAKRQKATTADAIKSAGLGAVLGGAFSLTTPFLINPIIRGVQKFFPRRATQEIAEGVEAVIQRQLETTPPRVIPVEIPDNVIQALVREEGEDILPILARLRSGSPEVIERLGQRADDVLQAVRRVDDNVAREATETIAENIVARNVARRGIEEALGTQTGLRQVQKELTSKFIDFASPIEKTLADIKANQSVTITPKEDFSIALDDLLRSQNTASRFIENEGLGRVIAQAEELDAFDELGELLIARQAQDIRFRRPDVELGRSATQDEAIIAAFETQLAPLERQVTEFSRRLLDLSVEGGLVAPATARELTDLFPNYVPIDRVFSVVEQAAGKPTRVAANTASVAQQNVVRSLKGSKRAIRNPLETLVERTQQIVLQRDKNRVAQIMAGYQDIPGNPFGIKPLKAGEKPGRGKVKFSAFINGEKQTFAIEKEFGDVLATANPQQLGTVGNILALPVRALKIGTTGINIPFALTNAMRDILTGATNSKQGLATTLNPYNYMTALGQVLRKGPVFREALNAGAINTSFDVLRSTSKLSAAALRAKGKGFKPKAKFIVNNPKEFIKSVGRGVEEVVSITEKTRRVQEFATRKKQLLKSGVDENTASILATEDARWVTANFLRRGNYGKVLNSLFPYLNAGIQGNRAMLRAFKARPAKTTAKVAATVFTPMAMATLWNLSDPKRREAYEDIRAFEKENNFIIVPPNPVKDEDGRWNVIKIPLVPNLAAISIPIRKTIEQLQGLDPVQARDIAQAGFGFVSPITPDFSSRRALASSVLSQVTPQAIRPSVEAFTNRRFFTDTPIVPQQLQGLPPALQTRPDTSGVAQALGRAADISPIKIEEFTRSTFGGLGSQALNAIDRVAARLGLIPEDQIGGRSISEDIRRRVITATGGEKENAMFDFIARFKEQGAVTGFENKQRAIGIVDSFEGNKVLERSTLNRLKREDKALFNKVKSEIKQRELGLTTEERLLGSLGVADGTRAQAIAEVLDGMSPDAAAEFEKNLRDKRVLTKEVRKQLRTLRGPSLPVAPSATRQRGVILPPR